MTSCLATEGVGGGLCVSPSGSHTLPSPSTPEVGPTEVPASARVQERSFFVRMKSTLTKRGLHVKASGYKVGVSARAQPHHSCVPSPAWGAHLRSCQLCPFDYGARPGGGVKVLLPHLPPPRLQPRTPPAGHPRDRSPSGPRPGPCSPRPHVAPGPPG